MMRISISSRPSRTSCASKGKRIFGLGYSMAAKEADAGTLFHHFLMAYGGTDIVLPSGKLNIDDAGGAERPP